MNEHNQQTKPTSPDISWGVITETADGGFNGEIDPREKNSTQQSKYVELHQWRRIDIPKQTGWFDDTKERAYYSDPARLEGRTVYVKFDK